MKYESKITFTYTDADLSALEDLYENSIYVSLYADSDFTEANKVLARIINAMEEDDGDSEDG